MSQFKKIIQQIKNWPNVNYYLFFFSLGVQTIILIKNKLTFVNFITFIGINAGVLCLGALNAARQISGWFGIVSCLCFIITSWIANDFLNLITYIIYIGILYIPIVVSKNWKPDKIENNIKHLNKKQLFETTIGTIFIFISTGYLIKIMNIEIHPWSDALTLALGISGSIICYFQYSEQFFLWILCDFANIILWFLSFKSGKATISMAINNFIYIINDLLAFKFSPWFEKK